MEFGAPSGSTPTNDLFDPKLFSPCRDVSLIRGAYRISERGGGRSG